MARGKQLQELLAQLRAETGRSQKVSVGVDEANNLKRLIQRNHEMLYDDHDWSFKNVERYISLANGQRYYDLPSDLSYDNIKLIKYKYNNVYTNLTRGIGFENYSVFDSNAIPIEKSSPALRWDIRDTGVSEQMEIWPVPNDTNTIGLIGTKTASPLILDSDRADLDDILVVLFSAAELLAKQKSGDAGAKLQQANARLLTLRRKDQAASPTIQIGLSTNGNNNTGGIKVIVS